MKIEFNSMKENCVSNFKGGEGNFLLKSFSDENNKILKGCLEPGATIGYHTHETSSEIIFILEGTGKCIVEDGEELLSKGDCHYCAKGRSHSLVNDGQENLVFYAVVPEQ